jgi:DNA adenine methylase
MTPIKNPVLKYYGSKFRLAKWIISHFPPHEHYVEPFGGGASILLLKPPSKIETYNDADADVVNFFRTLRKMPYRLSRQIEMTPWARDEYIACVQAKGRRNQLERARQLYFKLWMSRHAGTRGDAASWRRAKAKRSLIYDIKPAVLIQVARRLRHVQIENRDAMQLIGEMDSRDTLHYIDPPYLASTRTDKNRYAVELNQDGQHRELARVLYRLKGSIVLSGYACDLYVDLFESKGWTRVDTNALANGSVRRIESVWLSPATVKRLAKMPPTE